ncbi:AfsR/SARP family transcriptional regulator [Actinoallomurus acaciae]|uniref:BTAD domain-containing putative transcriptional regulator n=1 Tax=Actinoallomurus acaciae TaxID=502577 RepID=A0ABV5YVK6_9ACTN
MTGTPLRVDLLGPVRMSVADRPVNLGSGLQLATFVTLVGREGHRTSRREIVTALWESAPPTADGSVYTYLTGLRRAFAAADAPELLVSDRPGYRLRIPLEAQDLSAFEDLAGTAAAHAAEGDHERALDHYTRALHLVRGEPLAGVPGPYAEVRRHELGMRLLEVREAHARARLALGAHAEAAADLARLIELFPFSESLRELRMLALHRGGRPAEALELFRDTRETLRRELGSEPGPSLRRLHERILHDHAGETHAAVSPPRPPRPAADEAVRPLSGETRDLLRWLAVLGGDVPAAWLTLVLPESGHRLDGLAGEAVAAGLLKTGGGRVRFSHPARGEAVYQRITRPLRTVMHTRAARALAAGGGPPDAVARQLVVDDVELDAWAVDWLSANVSELVRTAPDLAVRLVERTTAECRMCPVVRERLRMALVRALSRLDRLPESVIADALATATDPADVTELNRYLAIVRLKGSEGLASPHVPQRARTVEVGQPRRRTTGSPA